MHMDYFYNERIKKKQHSCFHLQGGRGNGEEKKIAGNVYVPWQGLRITFPNLPQSRQWGWRKTHTFLILYGSRFRHRFVTGDLLTYL